MRGTILKSRAMNMKVNEKILRNAIVVEDDGKHSDRSAENSRKMEIKVRARELLWVKLNSKLAPVYLAVIGRCIPFNATIKCNIVLSGLG